MNTRDLLLTAGVVPCVLFMFASEAPAQRGSRGTRIKTLPTPQTNLYPAGLGPGGRSQQALGTARPVILLTGYWPPSNEMLREFSTSPTQNPGGWNGSDWEGRGYDVYSHFPEFPFGLGQGVGDLEVDYQDTTTDFWQIADNLKPIAVITFSRGFPDEAWELEMNNRNLALWIDDYTTPLQPTPAPPDASVPADAVRPSALPLQRIVDAVEVANINNLTPYIDINGNGGGFLSEFIAYLGVWYQSLHASPSDPAWCVAAGHIHVGSLLGAPRARQATRQTLRAVMRYVDEVTGVSGGETQWFCVPNDTSETYGAILTPTGSHSITQNNFELQVVKTVANNFGMAFYGQSQQPSAPLGHGRLCISAPLYRLPPAVQSNAQRHAHYPLDFTQAPLSEGAGQITPGSTWQFQYWLRDPAAGGSAFNLSSGLSITFAP